MLQEHGGAMHTAEFQAAGSSVTRAEAEATTGRQEKTVGKTEVAQNHETETRRVWSQRHSGQEKDKKECTLSSATC